MKRPPSTYYKKRKCRQTGTHIIVCAPGMEADPDEGWLTICNEHGSVCSHSSKRVAEMFAAVPLEWCEYCREEHEREQEAAKA